MTKAKTRSDEPVWTTRSEPSGPWSSASGPTEGMRPPPPPSAWERWHLGLHPHQLPASWDSSTWLLIGGRGAGKTRAGASWIGWEAQARTVRVALVGPTLHDVREVMVEGPSGLLALSQRLPRSDWPRWEASRRRISWPNGSVAQDNNNPAIYASVKLSGSDDANFNTELDFLVPIIFNGVAK